MVHTNRKLGSHGLKTLSHSFSSIPTVDEDKAGGVVLDDFRHEAERCMCSRGQPHLYGPNLVLSKRWCRFNCQNS